MERTSNNESTMALLVLSCDAYTEVGKIFFDLQEQYMGWFRGGRYFVNESKEFSYKDVKTINVGTECNWSQKVVLALQEVDSKYILFMLEDYFIGNPVKQEDIENAIKLMESHELKYYKITAVPQIKNKSTIASYLADIPSDLRYGINLQAAIFRKDFLLEIVSGKDRSAWEVESDLLGLVTNRFEGFLTGCVLDKRNIIDVHNAILKGKWFPNTIRYFKKRGYEIQLGNRSVLSVKEIVLQNVKRRISQCLPTAVARRTKRILQKLGFGFVTND